MRQIGTSRWSPACNRRCGQRLQTDDAQVAGVGEVMELANPDVWEENNRMKYWHA